MVTVGMTAWSCPLSSWLCTIYCSYYCHQYDCQLKAASRMFLNMMVDTHQKHILLLRHGKEFAGGGWLWFSRFLSKKLVAPGSQPSSYMHYDLGFGSRIQQPQSDGLYRQCVVHMLYHGQWTSDTRSCWPILPAYYCPEHVSHLLHGNYFILQCLMGQGGCIRRLIRETPISRLALVIVDKWNIAVISISGGLGELSIYIHMYMVKRLHTALGHYINATLLVLAQVACVAHSVVFCILINVKVQGSSTNVHTGWCHKIDLNILRSFQVGFGNTMADALGDTAIYGCDNVHAFVLMPSHGVDFLDTLQIAEVSAVWAVIISRCLA